MGGHLSLYLCIYVCIYLCAQSEKLKRSFEISAQDCSKFDLGTILCSCLLIIVIGSL